MHQNKQRIAVAALLAGSLTIAASSANATGMFGTESLNGDFVISADGGFVALTPFAPAPLRLSVSMVGHLVFDGNGRAHGNWSISFHNAAVPIGIRSHFETVGTYDVASDGHMFMEFEEFKIEPPGENDGEADGIVGFECYIVQRQQEARCILNTLLSLQQGPEPLPEPVTLSGSLLRQR